ncbi:MAG: damage-inducible protein [Acetobacteraceae bacterium]|nr:damage-inducible protein [Acetobacteraceae bacterium]
MFSTPAPTGTLARLRAQIARIEHGGARPVHRAVPFDIEAIDGILPGGLLFGALHEVAGTGPDTEHGAAAALFLGGVLARMEGPVLWVQQRADLFAPGLACIGLHPARILFAEAGNEVLAAMEEGLAHPGLAAVVGELSGRLTLVASRRLQLAAEHSGTMAALLRRSRVFDDPDLVAPSAAVTRWRIAAQPSAPPLPHAPSVPGLGSALWRLDLTRCRGGAPGSWIVEACDATGRLTLVANLADGSAAETGRAA